MGNLVGLWTHGSLEGDDTGIMVLFMDLDQILGWHPAVNASGGETLDPLPTGSD